CRRRLRRKGRVSPHITERSGPAVPASARLRSTRQSESCRLHRLVRGIAKGRSYVCDGYAHALEFTVGDQPPDYKDVRLDRPGTVTARARVSFASETPLSTAFGGQVPKGKTRLVELVVSGVAVDSEEVPADDRVHELSFQVPIA